MNIDQFGMLEKELLDGFQKEFPLEPRPFLAIAERLGCDEDTVLDLLGRMKDAGLVTRVARSSHHTAPGPARWPP